MFMLAFFSQILEMSRERTSGFLIAQHYEDYISYFIVKNVHSYYNEVKWQNCYSIITKILWRLFYSDR